MIKKKSLGQHFLHDKNIINDIVSASLVKKGDVVLEIGPGEGVLTKALIQTGAKVISVEKDDRLISVLTEKFKKEISIGQFELIHADILDFNLPKTLKKFKIVANIPYYITGQIIRIFLENKNQPESMTLLVQKEVAERIVAKDKKESLLSLSVNIFGTPKYVRTVGRGSFTPHPNIDSAVIHISDISRRNLDSLDEKFFFKIIRAGFAHKRKQLLSNLILNLRDFSTSDVEKFRKETLVKTFEKNSLNIKIRAEDVALENWLKLCKNLATKTL